jgi:hypothetical protein
MKLKAIMGVATAAAVTLLLAGCVTPTTYHPFNGTDGYSDIQFNNNTYEVRFQGNFVTREQSVKNMMLYRAAQITRDRGYGYFEVLSQNVSHQTQTFVSGGGSNTYTTHHWHHHHETTSSSTSYTPTTVSKSYAYNSHMKFKLLRQNINEPNVYNASTLMNSLATQINWPKPNKN